MRQKRKKWQRRKRGFYQIVAEAILEGTPFDVSKNNGGWTKVTELVSLYMLRDLSDADRHQIWNRHLAKVERTFNAAINYINDNVDGRHVFIHRAEGKRNNEFLSIRISYRQAKPRNADRFIRRAGSAVRIARKELQATMPEKLPELNTTTRKLLLGDTATEVKVNS